MADDMLGIMDILGGAKDTWALQDDFSKATVWDYFTLIEQDVVGVNGVCSSIEGNLAI